MQSYAMSQQLAQYAACLVQTYADADMGARVLELGDHGARVVLECRQLQLACASAGPAVVACERAPVVVSCLGWVFVVTSWQEEEWCHS